MLPSTDRRHIMDGGGKITWNAYVILPERRMVHCGVAAGGESLSESTYTFLVSEGIPRMGERLRSPGSRDVRGERERRQQRSCR
jgi:hypothetical protein